MSRKKSGLITRVKEEVRAAEKRMYKAVKATFCQYMTDTACIALNNLGWGKDRIDTFMTEWGKVYDEFHEALEDTPETDYYRVKFDGRVKPICKEDEFQAFEDRYLYMPDMKY